MRNTYTKKATTPIPSNEKQRLEALHKLDILDSKSERAFNELALLASKICDVPITLISLVDKDRQWFKVNLGLETKETSREHSFCAHAINNPDDVMEVEDARDDVRFFDNPLVTGDPNIVFYAGVPLVTSRGYALGTLCTIDSKPRRLTNYQMQSLQIIGKQITRLIEEARTQKHLKLSNKGYQKILDKIEPLIFQISPDFNSIYCNRALLYRLGYTSTNSQEFNLSEVLDTENKRNLYRRLVACSGRGDECLNFELQLKGKNKGLRATFEILITYNDQQKPVLYQGIGKSNSQNDGKNLISADNLYKIISDSASDIIALHDVKGAYLYVSPSVERVLGYAPQSLIGKTPYDIMHPEDMAETAKKAHKPILDGAKASSHQYRLKCSNGSYIWVESEVTAVYNSENEPTAIRSATRNIDTEKKQAEALKNSNDQLQAFITSMPAPVAMVDRKMKFIAASERFYQTYKIEATSIIGQSLYDVFSYTPNLYSYWRPIHEKALAGEGQQCERDKIVTEKGSVFYIKWEIKPWYGQEGEVGGLIILTEYLSAE